MMGSKASFAATPRSTWRSSVTGCVPFPSSLCPTGRGCASSSALKVPRRYRRRHLARAAAVRPPDPDLARALIRWQHAAGPFWQYVCAVPFLGEVAEKPGPAYRAVGWRPVAKAIAALARDAPTAVFLDLAPARSLTAAPALIELGFFVVPLLQRWVAAPAVLRCEVLVRQLIACAPGFGRPREQHGVVFLLDGERAGKPPFGRKPVLRAPRGLDNRYAYSTHLFPPPSLLRHEGIARVVWMARSGVATDLRGYARQLADAGLFPQEVRAAAGREVG